MRCNTPWREEEEKGNVIWYVNKGEDDGTCLEV